VLFGKLHMAQDLGIKRVEGRWLQVKTTLVLSSLFYYLVVYIWGNNFTFHSWMKVSESFRDLNCGKSLDTTKTIMPWPLMIWLNKSCWLGSRICASLLLRPSADGSRL
jgi:hypothetical protein